MDHHHDASKQTAGRAAILWAMAVLLITALPCRAADDDQSDIDASKKPVVAREIDAAELQPESERANDQRWVEMEQKRKERYEQSFKKLDKNSDKKLTFDEFLHRFGTLKAIVDKPVDKRGAVDAKRLTQFRQSFDKRFDVDGNGTIEHQEFMTRYYKPLKKPAVTKALKEEAAAAREAAKAARQAAKRKRDRDAAIKAEARAKEEREKLLDRRQKADRDRDE